MKQQLDRSLGLFSAINISTGTMIGSAIFVLAGTSFDVAGPAASLSIFLAGIGALFTGLSFAELVTLIPRAGGGYAYVRESTGGGLLAFVTGWGFWLGYSLSCGLFALGFGNFLHYFFPFIPRLIGAYALILYVMITNLQGVQNAGKLQNLITTGLLVLLLVYIGYGAIHVEPVNYQPFFTRELTGMFSAMGLLYMTYIGYGLITTASEEVINPEKTIPRAIIFSLVLVTFIKTATFVVGSGILPWDQLIPSVTSTPMIDTAIRIGGRLGGYLFALAGILATVSSINTAMMAGSRTSFALARDRRLPRIFQALSPRARTPVFSVIIVTLIVVVSTSIQNLEHISAVTSYFSLTGYSLVNVALMIFRKKAPQAHRAFRVPLFPLTPILGILVNIFLLFQLALNDYISLLAALGIMSLGLVYYFLILPRLKYAPPALGTQDIPSLVTAQKESPISPNPEAKNPFTVLVPIARPQTTPMLLQLGSRLAQARAGRLVPIHVLRVPEVVPLDSAYAHSLEDLAQYESVVTSVQNFARSENCRCHPEPLSVIARDIPKAIAHSTREHNAQLVLLGWHKSTYSPKMLGGLAHRIMDRIPTTVAVLKRGREDVMKRILFPYGGGFHAQAALELLADLSRDPELEITVLRVIDEDSSAAEEESIQKVLAENLQKQGVRAQCRIRRHDNLVLAVVEEARTQDLVILGVSGAWGIRQAFAGARTDQIMDRITCAGLVVRHRSSWLRHRGFRAFLHRLSERLE